MFAPKIAKPQTKAAASSTGNIAHPRSTPMAHRPGHSSAEPREAPTPRWDFSKIPVFPPDRTSRPLPPFPLTETPLPVQAKIVVGAADDPLEQEADRVARQVIGHMPAPNVSITAVPPQLSRDCTACGKEPQTLQTEPAGTSVHDGSGAPSIVHEVLRSPGQPLSVTARAFMEPRFGHDFSHVRVHVDAKAAESARLLDAHAYTVGEHVVFAAAKYAPDTHVGKATLAHELAHVIQQSGTCNMLRRQRAGAPVTDMPAGTQGGTGTGGSTAGAPKLDIEFNAFIPGSLGNPFASYDHPTDLKNQAAFDAAIKAIPGTWLEEPASFSSFGTGPWYYATDNRSFGGGSHRVGFKGSVSRSAIGSLKGALPLFAHDTSGSTHVRWTHTGHFTSKNETGSVEGPLSKSASVSHSEDRVDIDATESKVTTKGSAAYPFKAASPNIDYTAVFDLKQDPRGKTALNFEVTNNLFPYYELLINGGMVWSYASSSTGPGLVNLNRSATFKSGTWYF